MKKNVALPMIFLCMTLTLTLTVIPVKASVAGDVNGDSKVDILDLCIIARALGTDNTWPHGTGWYQYNPLADLNYDSKVSWADLNICASYYGTNVVSLDPTPGSTIFRLFPVSSPNSWRDLEIKNVVGLSQYEFMLEWDDTKLSSFSASESPTGLLSVGPTLFVSSQIAANKLLVGCTLLVPATLTVPTNTFKALATITFTRINTGNTWIYPTADLYDIFMIPKNSQDNFCIVI